MSEHREVQGSNQLEGMSARDVGLRVRAETIAFLRSARMTETLAVLRAGRAGVALTDALSSSSCSAVLRDLHDDGGWLEECWILTAEDGVESAPSDKFERAEPSRRFSRNLCLRRPSATAYCLRGFLSALTSVEVRASLSDGFGAAIRFRSADIARYNAGHYLRRHSDDFESRCLGLVWFLSPGWQAGCGGELIIESPAGIATVVPPTEGCLGVLAIQPSCFHQVAEVRSQDWTRYAIAAHYCRAD